MVESELTLVNGSDVGLGTRGERDRQRFQKKAVRPKLSYLLGAGHRRSPAVQQFSPKASDVEDVRKSVVIFCLGAVNTMHLSLRQ